MQIAPLYDDVADGPAGGVAHWVKTSDGLRIRVAHWTGPGANATVLLFPGRTEYIEKYGAAARELLARGFATIVVDWRGQGLADRMVADRAKGHVRNFTDYQYDVAATLAHIDALGLKTPCYLLAHSMGGAIGLRALMNGMQVKAAAFSAPMWGFAMAPLVRPYAWAVTHVADSIGMGESFVPGQMAETYVLREAFEKNTLTHDPSMWEAMKEQARAYPDLPLGGPTIRWLKTALAECRTLSTLPSPGTPTIAFLGSDEAIVDRSRIETRMQNWPGGTLHSLSACHHEPMMETPDIRGKVFDTIAAHFDAHPG